MFETGLKLTLRKIRQLVANNRVRKQLSEMNPLSSHHSYNIVKRQHMRIIVYLPTANSTSPYVRRQSSYPNCSRSHGLVENSSQLWDQVHKALNLLTTRILTLIHGLGFSCQPDNSRNRDLQG
jgi:hypothetical protein